MDNHAIVIAAADGVIRFWNPCAERVFGHSAEDVVGRTLDLIVPPHLREAHWAGFRRAMGSGSAAAEGQFGPFPALHANGEVAERQGMLSLLRGPRAVIVGAMVVFEDGVSSDTASGVIVAAPNSAEGNR